MFLKQSSLSVIDAGLETLEQNIVQIPGFLPHCVGVRRAPIVVLIVAHLFLVSCSSDEPSVVANPDRYELDEDTTLTLTPGDGVLSNDAVESLSDVELSVMSGTTKGVLELDQDGAITYTPNANYSGEDSFIYEVVSAGSQVAKAIVTLTVHPVNDAPTASSENFSMDEDTSLVVPESEGLLKDSMDIEGDALTISNVASAQHGLLAVAANGGIEYTPSPNFFGTETIGYSVTDANGASTPLTLTIEVRPVDDAPVGVGDSYQVDEDTTTFFDSQNGVAANDMDADGDSLTVSIEFTTPQGELQLFEDGSFSYTPPADFDGAESFAYTVSDGSLSSAPVIVTIQMLGANDAPIALGDFYDAVEDASLVVSASLGVLANDFDVDGDALVVSLVDVPLNGNVSLAPNGGFSYIPNENFFGIDTFSYVSSDGVFDSETVTVTVSVAGLNDRPISVASTTTTKFGRSVSDVVDIYDPDADELIHSIVSSPANGAVVLDPDTGSYTYTPDTDFLGYDTFSTRAYDGQLMSAAATVTVEVISLPAIATLLPNEGSTGQPLQLLGIGFGNSAGTILFDGQPVTPINWAAGNVAFEVPTNLAAGQYDVILTDVDGDSTQTLSYVVRPWIASVSPIESSPGTEVVIRGDALGTSPGVVRIVEQDATIVSWSNTEVRILIPDVFFRGEIPIVLTTAGEGDANFTTIVVQGPDVWITDPLPKGGYSSGLVWTGTEAVVVGHSGVVGRYNPGTNSWAMTSGVGAPHYVAGSMEPIWTGDRVMLAPNGAGASYDPFADSWRANGTSGVQSGFQSGFTTIWTGTETISWGGGSSQRGQRYDADTRTWTPTSLLGAPSRRSQHTAVWTGSEMIVWGGYGESTYHDTGFRYVPADDSWAPISTVGAPVGRSQHFAAWTGREMLIFGGSNSSGWLTNGAAYNPSNDSWRVIESSNAPLISAFTEAVWTGSEMMFLPLESTVPGGLYNPVTNSWRSMSNPIARATGWANASVWTGREVIFFDGNFTETYRYDPQLDTWTTVSDKLPSSYGNDYVAFTGTEMLIWGGSDNGIPRGLRYNIASKTWSEMTTLGAPPESIRSGSSVWTGEQFIIWGGSPSGVNRTSDGWSYHPATDTWTGISSVGVPEGRSQHSAVWTGEYMIIWGGRGFSLLSDGGIYHPASDSWTSISTVDGPGTRYRHSAVWAGTEMLIWGGNGQGEFPVTGHRYDLMTDSWLPMTPVDAPEPRQSHTTVLTDDAMLVWGGSDTTVVGTGGAYHYATDTWTPITAVGAPSARFGQSGVWTGTEMIIWGGSAGSGPEAAYIYDPINDSWRTSTTNNAPRRRQDHHSFWTGGKMLLWGGNSGPGYLLEYIPY